MSTILAQSGGGLPGVMDSGPEPEALKTKKGPASPAEGSEPKSAPAAAGEAPAIPEPQRMTTDTGIVDSELARPTEAGNTETEAAPAEAEPAEAGDADALPQPIKLGDREFKTIGELRRHVANNENLVKAERGRTKKAADLARQWAEHAKGLETALATRQQPTPEAEPEPAAMAAEEPADDGSFDPDAVIKNLDWGYHDQLVQQYGPRTALAWAMREVIAQTHALTQQMIREQVGPVLEERQAIQRTYQTVEKFRGVAGMKDPAGNLVYPEISSKDPRVVAEIVALWRTLPRALALTPEGIEHAVLKYRAVKARAGVSTPEPKASAPVVPPVVEGRGVPRAAGPAATVEANLKKAIAASGNVAKSKTLGSLGFVVD